jgi:5,10-methylenetetrahydromethanopterin reductase
MGELTFGAGLNTHGDAGQTVETARVAEQVGFDVGWLSDSHLLGRELFAVFGAVAATTSRMQVGSGVTHPFVRHFSLIASGFATLQDLAPGRIRLGIGVGDSGPANMGLRRASLGELEHTIHNVRALWSGDEVPIEGASLHLAAAPVTPLPIYVAAASDRTHAMTGRVAQGALISGDIDDLPTTIEVIRAAEREAGRPPGSVRIVLWTACAIDEDREAARSAARSAVYRRAMHALGRKERLGTLTDADAAGLAQVRAVYDERRHGLPMDPSHVPDAWVDRFSISGTPAEVAERCRLAAALGANEVSVLFTRSSDENLREQMRRFSRAVIEPLHR